MTKRSSDGSTNKVELATPVLIDFKDLSSGKDLSKLVEAAYGYDGLGKNAALPPDVAPRL